MRTLEAGLAAREPQAPQQLARLSSTQSAPPGCGASEEFPSAVRADFRGPHFWREPELSCPPLRQELLESLRSAEGTLERQLRRLLQDFRNRSSWQSRQLGWSRARNHERNFTRYCSNVLDALSQVRACVSHIQSLPDSQHELAHIAMAGRASKCLAQCRRLSLDSLPKAAGEAEEVARQPFAMRRENSAPARLRPRRSSSSSENSSLSVDLPSVHNVSSSWDHFSLSNLTESLTMPLWTVVHAAEEVYGVVAAPAAAVPAIEEEEEEEQQQDPRLCTDAPDASPASDGAARTPWISTARSGEESDGRSATSCPEEPELKEQLALEALERDAEQGASPRREMDGMSTSSCTSEAFSEVKCLPATRTRAPAPGRARAHSSYTHFEAHVKQHDEKTAEDADPRDWPAQLSERWSRLCSAPQGLLASSRLPVGPGYEPCVPEGREGVLVPLPVWGEDPGAVIAHALLSDGLWLQLEGRLRRHCLRAGGMGRLERQMEVATPPAMASRPFDGLDACSHDIDSSATGILPLSAWMDGYPDAYSDPYHPAMFNVGNQGKALSSCLGCLRGEDARVRVGCAAAFAGGDQADSPIQVEVAAGPASPSASWSVTVFQPTRFHFLRHMEFGDDAAFCTLLRQCSPMVAKGGKSKAGFWCSAGGELVLKEVRAAEGRYLSENFAGRLAQRLMDGACGHPSLLCEVFALCDIRSVGSRRGAVDSGKARTFIVMRNLRHGMADPKAWQYFDLKGVGRDRKVESTSSGGSAPSSGKHVRLPPEDLRAPTQKVYWDSEFLQLLGGDKIPLRGGDYEALLQALDGDTRVLEEIGVVDYSLLLALRRPEGSEQGAVRLCLIDYLQPYTLNKQLESGFKKVVLGRANPTIVCPSDYRRRFLAFLKQAFTIQEAQIEDDCSPTTKSWS